MIALPLQTNQFLSGKVQSFAENILLNLVLSLISNEQFRLSFSLNAAMPTFYYQAI